MGTPPSGAYALLIALAWPTTIEVGRLGRTPFAAGYYLYVGRARRGLGARLARHQRQEKRLRWHIDYLLTVAHVQEVWVVASAEPPECAWAQALRALPGATRAVPGFGSSDCRCPGHLIYVPQRPRAGDIRRLLPGAVRLTRQDKRQNLCGHLRMALTQTKAQAPARTVMKSG